MTDFTTENFSANLKLAASYYPSISEMCRKLGINRQQFMKYLSGTSFPSRYNMRRMCDFFGFDEYEILLPHDQFRNIVRLRPVQDGDSITMPPGLTEMLSQGLCQVAGVTLAAGPYGFRRSGSDQSRMLSGTLLHTGSADPVSRRLRQTALSPSFAPTSSRPSRLTPP